MMNRLEGGFMGTDYWQWWILSGLLLVVELVVPSTIFLWMGISAASVGGLIFFVPSISFEVQLLIFSIVSLISVVISRYLLSHTLTREEGGNTLNRRGSEYIGRIFTLERPIINGIGKVNIGDGSWLIEGEDCPAGTRVRVLGLNGIRLQTEIVPPAVDDNILKEKC
jgi:inner membrane protein